MQDGDTHVNTDQTNMLGRSKSSRVGWVGDKEEEDINSAVRNTNISQLFLRIELNLHFGADEDKVSEDRDREVNCNLAQDATDPLEHLCVPLSLQKVDGHRGAIP